MSQLAVLTDNAYLMNLWQKNVGAPLLQVSLFNSRLELINSSNNEILANIPIEQIETIKMPSALTAFIFNTQGANLVIKTSTKTYKLAWGNVDKYRIISKGWTPALNIFRYRKKTQLWVSALNKLRSELKIQTKTI